MLKRQARRVDGVRSKSSKRGTRGGKVYTEIGQGDTGVYRRAGDLDSEVMVHREPPRVASRTEKDDRMSSSHDDFIVMPSVDAVLQLHPLSHRGFHRYTKYTAHSDVDSDLPARLLGHLLRERMSCCYGVKG